MILRNVFIFMLTSLSIVFTVTTHAEVVLDGTLGPSGSLQGPNFAIDPSFGQQVGANLFHSFESFNLDSSESATFIGATDISNVINRVTGGQPSSIDGLFSSRIPNADVYFLNPAGVMFGPNAQINVPGSLYISSGDYLKLGDSGRFDASVPENTLLTIASPSAFGFLDNTPSNIIIAGSQLILNNDTKIARLLNGEDVPPDTLALIGGDIKIEDGQLISIGSDIHLVSVASTGEAPIESRKWTNDTFAHYGTISITDNGVFDRQGFGNIDSSGLGGGEVFIRAGQFVMDNGWIFADTNGDNAGRGININVSDMLALQNASRITTEVYARSDQLLGRGNAGSININAGDISLIGGSQIQSSSQTEGLAGNITLAAQRALSIKGADSTGNYRSGILTNTLGSGAGGEMSISADALIMEDGATIRAETLGFSDAGNLSIQTNTLTLSNDSQINISTGNRNAFQGTGKAGQLTVVANESISIGGGEGYSGLLTNTFTQGQGGSIVIMSPEVDVYEKGLIQAGTQYYGNGGSIFLNVDTLNLSQGGFITTAATLTSSGLGGNVKVQAQNLRLSGESYISASSFGKGEAGNIILNLDDKLIMRDSFIATAATESDGGNIFITAQNYLYFLNSKISTSVGTGFGSGGNIIIRPEFVIQDKSPIIAEAYGGPGGNIDITTTSIYQFPPASLSRISASSQFGVDGEVKIDSPEINLGDFMLLPNRMKEAQLYKGCQIESLDELSTFKIQIQGNGRPRLPDSHMD